MAPVRTGWPGACELAPRASGVERSPKMSERDDAVAASRGAPSLICYSAATRPRTTARATAHGYSGSSAFASR